MENLKNLEKITFSRFLAALSIVVLHFGLNAYPFNLGIISMIFNKASYFVTYFFVLSGFIISVAYQKDSIPVKYFYLNRISKIYPLYLFSLIIVVTVYYTFYRVFPDLIKLILNAFLLTSWVVGFEDALNLPSWSLSVEIFFYLLFPFLFKYLLKPNNNLISIFVAILFYFFTNISFNILVKNLFKNHILEQYFNTIAYNPLFHLNSFIVGIVTGNVISSNSIGFLRNFIKDYSYLILFSCIISLIVFMKYENTIFTIEGVALHHSLYSPLFALIIICLYYNEGYLIQLFKLSSFQFLGKISYSIYILQVPTFMLFEMFIFKFSLILDDTIKFYVFLAILIVFSSVTYIIVEEYFKRILRYKFSKNNFN